MTRIRPELVPPQNIVFIHMPKCGGTSLHRWLLFVIDASLMSGERRRMPLELADDRRAALESCKVFSGHFDVLDLPQFPDPKLTFTVLRDPVDRLVSLYDFWRAHNDDHIQKKKLVGPRIASALSFEDFLRNQESAIRHDIDNALVRTMTGLTRTSDPIDGPQALDEACANLEKLDHVGLLDRLDETTDWLMKAIGAPLRYKKFVRRANVRGEWKAPMMTNVERTVVSDQARELMQPLVELDIELVKRFAPAQPPAPPAG